MVRTSTFHSMYGLAHERLPGRLVFENLKKTILYLLPAGRYVQGMAAFGTKTNTMLASPN